MEEDSCPNLDSSSGSGVGNGLGAGGGGVARRDRGNFRGRDSQNKQLGTQKD